ncbi:IS1249 family transposase [Glutamicibacter sp. X7]
MDVVPIGVTPTRQNTHLCSICQSPQKKNGKRNGKQRWRCITCNASTTRARPDTTARNVLAGFISWLTSKQSQAEFAGGTGRTFRQQTQWCWNVHPFLHHTGEVFAEIQIDGIYLRPGWCLLIAIAHGKVIGWQWCDQEKSAAWLELLKHFPEPRVVVTDGGSGLLKALKSLWPKVKIQRCLVHLQRNVRTHLSMRPRTEPGKSLRRLSLKLTKIKTRAAAAEWSAAFASWQACYQHLLEEKTYAKDWNGPLPKSVKSTRPWWYTHERLRNAYRSMATPLKRGHVFTYLDEDLDGLSISATTNMIEGGINSGIRALISHHRGMPIEHRRRACEWFCWNRAEPRSRANLPTMIRASGKLVLEREATMKPDEEQVGPVLYGRHTTAEEGLYSRSGWGGRSH